MKTHNEVNNNLIPILNIYKSKMDGWFEVELREF